jgi:glycine C-acetyltransferase
MILLRVIPTAPHTLLISMKLLLFFEAIREKLENGTYKEIASKLK